MNGKSSSAGRPVSSKAGWRVGLIFVCLAAGIVAAGYFYYRNYEKNYRSAVERQLSAIAELKVGELAQWRKERLEDANILNNNPAFSGLVRRFLVQPEDAEAQRQLQAWMGKYQDNHRYDRVFLLDAQGVLRMSAPETPAPVASVILTRVPEILRSGQPAFQDFFRDEQNQRIYLSVLVPLLDEADGNRPLGVLVMRIDPATYLYPFIQRWPTPSKTAETLLIRREGHEAVFLNELRFQTNTALALRAPLDQKALPAARAASKQEGVMEGVDYRGVSVVAALRAIPDSPWSLVARMDLAEVYAPLRERLWQMVVLIGALLVGAGAGIVLLWRQQRVRFYRERYEAAAALRESEERFRILFEEAADIILQLEITPEGMPVIRDANSATFKLLGYERDELIGQPVSFLEAAPDASKAVDERRRNILSGRGTMFETTHRRKDGTIRDFECSATEMKIGSKTYAISVERDITVRKRAEAALRESEARYRALFNESTDGILIADIETKTFKYANPALCRMLGYTEDELRTMGVLDIHPKDAVQSVVAEFEAQTRGDKTLATDIPCLRKDGSVVHVDINAGTITIDDRPCNVGFFRDITARKRIEEALRESQAFYHSLVDQLPAGVFRKDREGRYVFVSPWFCRLKGIKEEGFLGKTPQEVAASEAAKQDPTERAMKYAFQGADQHVQIMQTGTTVNLVEEYKDAAGGKQFVHAVKFPVLSSDGKVTGTQGVLFDITTRIQAEARIREQAALLDTANDAIYVTALDHTILYWNRGAERTYGWTSAEVLNRKTTELIFPDQAVLKALNPVLFRQGSWSGERRQITKSGGMVEVFSRLTLVRNEQGHPQSVFVIDSDVTELVRAREAAEGATKAKSQFLAMMSHEIRTPLNGVLGFANLLADTRLDEQQRDFLRTILTSGESLLTILNDILNFSKLEAGRTELEARPVALRLLVESVLDLLAAPARAKSLELVYWIEPDVPGGIVGDETGLRQILLNLAGNALKFTSAGHVEISVAGAPPGADGTRQLVFHVRDTGIGIPPERQDRLFRAFSQVDASTTRNYGGTGLGLAISQRLVTLMGGEIGVTSEPGKGSDFHFTLRVAEADVTDQLRTRASVAPQEIETALRGRRVLVVDDLPANLRLLDKILSQYGAGMVAAPSGAEALAALDRQRFDLAVLNYLMPGADGVALATAIRQRADASRLPLILVTSAQPSQTETPPGLFAAVIPKPLHNLQFASAVAQALLGPKLGWPEPPAPHRGELLRPDQTLPPHRYPL